MLTVANCVPWYDHIKKLCCKRQYVFFWGRSGKLNGFLRCKCIERDYGPVYRSHSGSKGGVLSMVLSSGNSSVAWYIAIIRVGMDWWCCSVGRVADVKRERSLNQTLLSLYPSSHFKLRGCLIISVLSLYLTVICYSANTAGCLLYKWCHHGIWILQLWKYIKQTNRSRF